MADQVREAWIADSQEVALAVGGLPTTSLAHADTMRAIRSAWDAGAASHAAEVEALRSALADAVNLIETLVAHHGARLLPAGEERLEGYRAALKGDKP